jgi:LacI family transcriptional regulator
MFKKVRLQEIAEQAGVSIATVSRSLINHPAVGDVTKEKILKLSNQLGYRPLRKTKPKNIFPNGGSAPRFGYIILGSSNQFLLSSLVKEAGKIGVRVEFLAIEDLSSTSSAYEQILEFSKEVCGIIISGLVKLEILSCLEKNKIPYIVFGDIIGNEYSNYQYGQVVTTDVVGMGRFATQHFLKAGHKRIALIYGSYHEGIWASLWIRGYCSVLIDNLLPIDRNLLYCWGNSDDETAVKTVISNQATAYILPDIGYAARFLSGMKANGIVIPKNSIMICASPQVRSYHGLEEHPWVCANIELFCKTAIYQLSSMTRKPMPCFSLLQIPFESGNLNT